MTFILGLIILGLFFLALHYFTEFDNSQKISIVIIVLSIISIAIMFNEYNEAKNKEIMDATLKFKQNATIKCAGRDINSTNYTLSIGTFTFIGKENTPDSGQMISASECE